MIKVYLAQVLQNDIITLNSINAGDTIEFEMPPFCSGDYMATVYSDEYGLYIDSKDNFFGGCRDFTIIKKPNPQLITPSVLVDNAYKRYRTETLFNSDNKWLDELDGIHLGNGEKGKVYRQFTKEQFINKCKTDPEFSEKWGLKIEERELSLEERKEILYSKFRKGPIIVNGESYVECAPTDINFEFFNIPTKLITITYNNETIESYE